MKKSTMKSIVSYLSETGALPEVLAELNAELAKGEEKAQANRDLYAVAHDVVIEAMSHLTDPATISDLFTEVEKSLPEGFSKSKLQYAVTRLWVDEIVKTEGKVNTYSLKA